jgi:GntR family transcriptional regulator/MocR family aminotransferase
MLRALPLSLGGRIDAQGSAPLYMQIIGAIVRDIETGRLTPGTYLPSSRELAADLRINRKTVVLAYDELIAQGWLTSAGTRGTLVSQNFPVLPKTMRNGSAHRVGDVEPHYRMIAPPLRPLALPSGDGIKLDEGTPDGRLFPMEALMQAYRAAIPQTCAAGDVVYRDPLGAPALREALAEMLRRQRGLSPTPAEICVTRGSQHAILLTAQALLKPGDVVLVETLTYEPAVAAFRAVGAAIVPVKLDAQGIDVQDVERLCRKHRVRALFLTPHHQFPTTVSLQPDRRLRLLDLARQFAFAIIEDDYDHDFHFASQPLLPMSAYAPEHVIYIGSLSKSLLPALRIGYIVAPPAVMAALAHAISLSDGMGNNFTEVAAADLVANGTLRRHTRKVRQVYATRRESFAAKLKDLIGDDVAFDMPDGGLAFWLKFPRHDMDRLESKMFTSGLRFAASRSFMTIADAPRGIRIGFASKTEAEAEVAITTLRRALVTL